MRFPKWLMKKGAIGGATRLLMKAYHMQKESNPNARDIWNYNKVAIRHYR